MYYIGRLPKNYTLVFVYGKRLTNKKLERIEELFTEYCKERYPEISLESYTKENIKRTVNNYFGKFKKFERTETGYRTESSYCSHTNLTVIQI